MRASPLQLLQSKRRASVLEADSLRRQLHDEDPATSIQQPKQHGFYLEEDMKGGSHHAAQKYEQQLHEIEQQQLLQAQQQHGAAQVQHKQQEADEQLGAPPAKVPLLTIAAMTTAMAAMSGLGAVPYFFVGTMPAAWSGLANAVACGVMIVSGQCCAQPAAVAASTTGCCASCCACNAASAHLHLLPTSAFV